MVAPAESTRRMSRSPVASTKRAVMVTVSERYLPAFEGRISIVAGSKSGAWRITTDHVLPNIANVLIVQATIQFAMAILAEAALSYLGLGTQPPQPSWGRMLNEAQTMLFEAPLLAVYPGVAIALAVLGLNLMGDGLRDLLDPKLARQR